MTADRSATRLLLLAQALLWLAAAGASALLFYWLCIDPAYGMPWSAETGAVLFALLGIYAAAGCLGSLCDMMHRRPARRIGG
jgi:apolipoprotein N-acyltransferase